LNFVGTRAKEGFYWLTVSNESGSVTGSPTEFFVEQRLEVDPPVIFATAGEAARRFVARIIGREDANSPTTFTWTKVGAGTVGFGDTLSFESIGAAQRGEYTVVANIGTYGTLSADAKVFSSPIAITVSPERYASLKTGESLTLSVVVDSGTYTPSYQWRYNGKPVLVGGTSSQYVVVMAEGRAGVYDVVVSAAGASVTSAGSRVEMFKKAAIDNARFVSQARTIMDGGALELSVQVTEGTPPYSYRWLRDGKQLGGENGSVSGADTDNLTVQWSARPLAGLYRVAVGRLVNGTIESGSEVLSDPVLISEVRKPDEKNFEIVPWVDGKESAVGAGLNALLRQGSQLVLRVRQKDSGVRPAVHWRFNGALLREGTMASGVSTGTLTIRDFATSLEGDYEAVLRNDAGEAALKAQVFFAVKPVEKLSELAPLTLMHGDSLRWSAFEATGGGTLRYSWRRQGSSVEVGTSSLLNLGTANASHSGSYTLTVSNLVSGSATLSAVSSSSQLRVFSPLNFERISLKVGSVSAGVLRAGTLTAELNRGDRVELAAGVTGGVDPVGSVTGLRYQWMREGVPINGGTNSTYVIDSTRAADLDVTYSVTLSVVDPQSRRVLREFDSGDPKLGLAGGAVRLQARKPLAPPNILRGGVVLTSGTALAGGSVSLIAQAGTERVTYQWLYNGAALANGAAANIGLVSGVTGSLLTIGSLSASASGSYSVRVRSELNPNDVQIKAAYLDVLSPARFTQHPVSVKVSEDPELRGEVRLRALAQGTDSVAHPMIFEWRRNGEKLTASDTYSGVDSNVLVISGSADISDVEGQYQAVVGNGLPGPAQKVSSNIAIVMGVPTELKFAPLLSSSVLLGGSAEFVLNVSKKISAGSFVAAGALPYQWRRNGKVIPGAKKFLVGGTALLKFSAGFEDAGEYDAVVTSGGQSIASPTATLTVLEPARILRDLSPMLGVVPGTLQNGSRIVPFPVTLSVEASGSGSLKYAWYEHAGPSVASGTLLSGSLSSLAVEASDITKWYSVSVSAGTEISTGAVKTGTITSASSARVPVQLLPSVISGFVRVPSLDTSTAGGIVAMTVTAGEGLVLSGSASGGPPLSYQWRRNGRAILGASSPELKIDELRLSDGGSYQLVATNPRGALVCGTIDLTVAELDVIVTQPQGARRASEGEDVVLRVGAVGRDLKYQWRKDGRALTPGSLFTGVDGPKLTLLDVKSGTGGASGVYDVLVSHAFGSSVSSICRLTVLEPIKIITQPSDVTLVEGSPAALTVKAEGADLKYRWRKGGKNLPRQLKTEDDTTPYFTLSDSSADTAGVYDVIVYNDYESKTSSAVTVTNLRKVLITEHPNSVSVPPGQSVTFYVGASGSLPKGSSSFVYQWRKNGVPIVGANSASYQISEATPPSLGTVGDSGRYDVLVSNDLNAATSLPAVLTVFSAPIFVKAPLSQVANAGDKVRLDAEVEGTPPINYRWMRVSGGAETPVGSGNKPSYILPPFNPDVDGGTWTYRLYAENNYGSSSVDVQVGSFDSSRAFTEVVAPSVSDKKFAFEGQEFKLAGVRMNQASGFVFQFEWRRNGAPLAVDPRYSMAQTEVVAGTVTGGALSIKPVDETDAGHYELLVRAMSGGLEKGRKVMLSQTVEVKLAPRVSGVFDQFVPPGGSITFSPVLSPAKANDEVDTYTWEFRRATGGGFETKSTDALTYTVSDMSHEKAGNYRFTVVRRIPSGDSTGTVVGVGTAMLKMGRALELKPLPATLQAKPRERVVLMVNMIDSSRESDPTLRYQWRFNGQNIVGATQRMLVISGVRSENAGSYDVIVSNNLDRVKSTVTSLTLREPTRITDFGFVTNESGDDYASMVTVNPGESVRLKVGLSGSEDVICQWIQGTDRSARVIPNVTTKTYVIDSVSFAEHEGWYMAV
jgi:hypothetical protein